MCPMKVMDAKSRTQKVTKVFVIVITIVAFCLCRNPSGKRGQNSVVLFPYF